MAYPRKHPSVYLFRDQDGILTYVGSSFSPITRLYDHAGKRDWWTEVSRIDVRHFATGEEARAHERELIKTHNPRHNVVSRTDLPKRERIPVEVTYETTPQEINWAPEFAANLARYFAEKAGLAIQGEEARETPELAVT